MATREEEEEEKNLAVDSIGPSLGIPRRARLLLLDHGEGVFWEAEDILRVHGVGGSLS